jgi:hypothetical protein
MINFYDKEMNLLETIEFIEITWNRKWTEAGDFTIYTIANEWNDKIKYINIDGRPETGIVKKIVIEEKIEGTFLTAKGYFLEKLIDLVQARENSNVFAKSTEHPEWDDWVSSTIEAYALIDNAIGIEKQPRPSFIGGIYIAGGCKWPDEVNLSIKQGDNIGEVIRSYLILWNMSPIIEIRKWPLGPVMEKWEKDPDEPHFTYLIGIKLGRDISEQVIFGKGYENVSRIEYQYDDSDSFPYYQIAQTMETTGFSNEEVISDESGQRKGRITEHYIDANNRPRDVDYYPKKVIEGNVSGIELKPANEAQIREQMRQQAKVDMLNHYKQETIVADVIQNNTYYLKDYDIGDLCSISFDEIEQTFKARIVEVSETYSKNKLEVKITFGTPRKAKYIPVGI